MGLRSWLTKVEYPNDYLSLKSQIEHNPYANGIHYVINVTEKCPLSKGIWVVWSGDGNGSLNEYMSPYFQSLTQYLDDLRESFPGYNNDPTKYGTIFEDNTEDTEVLNFFQKENENDRS